MRKAALRLPLGRTKHDLKHLVSTSSSAGVRPRSEPRRVRSSTIVSCCSDVSAGLVISTRVATAVARSRSFMDDHFSMMSLIGVVVLIAASCLVADDQRCKKIPINK